MKNWPQNVGMGMVDGEELWRGAHPFENSRPRFAAYAVKEPISSEI